MKKIFAVLLAAAMMLSVAACSSGKDKDNNAEQTEPATKNEATEEVTPDKGSTEQPTEQPTEQLTEEEQVISGTITDAAMHTVTIETEDGATLTMADENPNLAFSIPDEADRTQVDGMLIGDTLEITYTGTIDGEDTSNATVLKLIETAANPQ